MAIDPVTILILVCANGYTADVASCASRLSKDRDLWSYLCSPKAKGGSHWLAAAAAAALGHVDRVRFLIDVGAPLEARSRASRQPLTRGLNPVTHPGLYFDVPLDLTALGWAALYGQVDTATTLMDLGAAIDGTVVQVEEALQVVVAVVFGGQIETEVAATVHHPNNASPLAAAVMGGQIETVRFLLSRGADMNVTRGVDHMLVCLVSNYLFNHALDDGLRQLAHDIILLLLHARTIPCDIVALNVSLRAAALVPHLDMVSLLLECGADAAWIREGGIKGRGYTALHYAAMQSDDRAVECAVMLLDPVRT